MNTVMSDMAMYVPRYESHCPAWLRAPPPALSTVFVAHVATTVDVSPILSPALLEVVQVISTGRSRPWGGADEHLQPVRARGGGLAGVTQSDRVCDAGRGGYLLVDGRPGLAGRELRVRVAVPVELEFDRSRPLGRVVRVQGLAGCPRELRFVEAGDVRPLPQIGIAGVGEPLPVCGGR